MNALIDRKCTSCKAGTLPLKGDSLNQIAELLDGGWQVVKQHHLEKEFEFKNFLEALEFTNRVGDLAEQEGHHPDIYLTWGKVRLKIWTHVADGLTESDFILAAKVNALG